MSTPRKYVPRFEVDVQEGKQVFREGGVVSDLSVETSVEKPDQFSFTLNYEYDHATGEFTNMDWDLFSKNTTMKVSMGYGGTSLTELCVGRIKSVTPEFPSSGAPTIRVMGYGLSYEMTYPKIDNAWGSLLGVVDLAEVVYALNTFGMFYPEDDVDLSPTASAVVIPGTVVQNNESCLAFLNRFAEKYGHEVYGACGKLHVKPLTHRYGDPVATLDYDRDLQSFSPRVNPECRRDVQVLWYWNYWLEMPIFGVAVSRTIEQAPQRAEHVSDLRSIIQNATDIKIDVETNIPVFFYTDAEIVALSKLVVDASGYVSGSGETVGNPDVRAGTVVSIEGVTEKFSQDYYVTNATHRIGGSGYQTSFELEKQVEIEGLSRLEGA